MREQEEYSRAEEYYSDWKEDNIDGLRRDFIDDNEDLFAEYCKEQFSLWSVR